MIRFLLNTHMHYIHNRTHAHTGPNPVTVPGYMSNMMLTQVTSLTNWEHRSTINNYNTNDIRLLKY